ncbi:MAG: RluA family pseudouridine synthase, partial [Ureaplasma sp.]|nr:RluA family pseudouridine synthase [Ureaplasma sp.]
NNIELRVIDSNSLFNFLVKNTNFNQKQIKKFFLDNKIFVNDKLANNINLLLNNDDLVSIKLNNSKQENQKNENQKEQKEIEILYEDDYLLVINKPNNLLTHKTKFNEDNTLQDYLNQKFSFLANVQRSGITHRLDRDTTGILVIAKNNDVFAKIQKAFEDNEVIRKYNAIVLNHFNDEYYEINKMIGHSHNDSLKMTVNNPKNPKKAITLVKVIDYPSQNHALVECELKTGRTHQIRVHMNYINHPILNDPLYGTKLNNDDYNQYLHCTYVKFNHPILFKNIEIKSSLPNEFLKKIEELKNEK